MASEGPYGRRLLIGIDAHGYALADGRRQLQLQRDLLDIIETAAERAGLHRRSWDRQQSGDGELAVLPHLDTEDTVLDKFVPQIARSIEEYNSDRIASRALRLRMAVHHGVAFHSSNGFGGAAPIVVARLLNSNVARSVQSALPDAPLVLIVSHRIYLDTIAQNFTSLRPNNLRHVTVSEKEYSDAAWLYVPGFDINKVDLDAPGLPPPLDPQVGERAQIHSPQPETLRRTGRDQQIIQAQQFNQFEGPVRAKVIGIVHNSKGHDD